MRLNAGRSQDWDIGALTMPRRKPDDLLPVQRAPGDVDGTVSGWLCPRIRCNQVEWCSMEKNDDGEYWVDVRADFAGDGVDRDQPRMRRTSSGKANQSSVPLWKPPIEISPAADWLPTPSKHDLIIRTTLPTGPLALSRLFWWNEPVSPSTLPQQGSLYRYLRYVIALGLRGIIIHGHTRHFVNVDMTPDGSLDFCHERKSFLCSSRVATEYNA